ncbi:MULTISPECIES: hypothetical protein [Arthrobacter]|uniref:SipW-cognate class signal peptide n=2 Tax=Arthrobacter TaxID=1663 RepID=A0ABU9KNY3_9MICC|nr:hypothetical protein [Arthrobacter sp. YJM1]MDP5228621.1 hypothetical protein [Arthrobacter sp. YJM1]
MTISTTETNPTDSKDGRRTGRKRAIITGAALLGFGALATSAAFTDFALLDLNGAGGFGGDANKYNIQVATQQVDHVSDVQDAQWLEANPDAETLTIAGADSLIPGGQAIYAKIPVRNASQTMRSSLDLTLENTTQAGGDSVADAKNAAYSQKLAVDIAMVDDASDLSAAGWTPIPMDAFAPGGKSGRVSLGNLDATAGKVAVLKIRLDSAEDDNAANGGKATVQARFDGTAIN